MFEFSPRARKSVGQKPRMLLTVALANKMARIIWALLVKRKTTERWSQPKLEPGA
jgi:hypothetical protein